MQKLALVAVIAATTPMIAVADSMENETSTNTEIVKHMGAEDLVFVAPLEKKPNGLTVGGRLASSAEPVGTGFTSETLTIDQITKLIQEDKFDAVSSHIDYGRMHAAYLSQMEYINGKVRSLSERVGEVAAGTFETRVREGSMMLGLISEAIDSIVANAAESEEDFRKFVKIKFKELSMINASYEIEEDEGVYLISIKQPQHDSKDILTAFRLPDGSFRLVAFIPHEMEDINNIINGLFLAATSSEHIGDELQRRALTESAIGLSEHRASNKNTIVDAIDSAQSEISADMSDISELEVK